MRHCAERFRGSFHRIVVTIPDRDTGARFKQAFGDGKADAPRRTGYDGRTAREIDLIHSFSPTHLHHVEIAAAN